MVVYQTFMFRSFCLLRGTCHVYFTGVDLLISVLFGEEFNLSKYCILPTPVTSCFLSTNIFFVTPFRHVFSAFVFPLLWQKFYVHSKHQKTSNSVLPHHKRCSIQQFSTLDSSWCHVVWYLLVTKNRIALFYHETKILRVSRVYLHRFQNCYWRRLRHCCTRDELALAANGTTCSCN